MTNTFYNISSFCEQFSHVEINSNSEQTNVTKIETVSRNFSISTGSEEKTNNFSAKSISCLIESSTRSDLKEDVERIYQIFTSNVTLFQKFIKSGNNSNIKFESFLKILDMDLANRYVHLRTAIYQFAFSLERFNWIQMDEADIDPITLTELIKFEKSHQTQDIDKSLDAFDTTYPTTYLALMNDRLGSSTSLQGQGNDVIKAKTAWKKAHQRIRNYAKKGSLCLDALQLVARDVGRGQEDIPHPGKFRTHPARLTSGDFRDLPPPDTYLDELMAEYENWLSSAVSGCKNSQRSIILTATQAYQRLLSIHPFENGNGRVGRLVMDYVFESVGLFPPILGKNINAAVFALKPKSKEQMNAIVLNVFNGVKQTYSLIKKEQES